MDWLPKDANFLTVFGAVLAAGTALLGLVVGLGQFTGAARARRIIEWTSAALDSEKDAARKIVLERLKLRGQGYLVAARYVPGRLFTEAILWIFLAPVAFVISAVRDGAISFQITAIAASVAGLGTVGRRTVRLYAERTRVARQFAIGGMDVEPVQIDLLGQMEGGTRHEFTLGYACSVLVMGTSALLAWALLEEPGNVLWFWTLVGAVACGFCFQEVHAYAERWSLQAPKNLLQERRLFSSGASFRE